jgi:ABC-2 type transport system permease protein
MSDALTLSARCLRLSRRELDTTMMAIVLPVLLMVMFVEFFGGAISAGTRHYVTYVVPGVLLLCAGYGSGLTAVAVCKDMTGGIIDRLRSMDVRAAPLLAGHVVASAARNVVSCVVVVLVALLLGFRPTGSPLDCLAAAAVLLAFILAVSWLSAALGLLTSTPDAAQGVTFVIMFLPYASSAFVPVRTMPAWVRGFAAHQPITAVTDVLRHLLVGTPTTDDVGVALAWCVGIAVCSVIASGWLFARRTAR